MIGQPHVEHRGIATVVALWITVGLLMGGWIAAQRAIDDIRETWPPAYPLLFLPNGQYLSAASLGYRIVLADAIYLWSIQYYGHRRTAEGRSYLWQIYDVITDLDPNFVDAYLVGALIMASDMDDPALAIELLNKGIGNNADEWLLPLEAGWYCYLHLEDYAAAERYFQQAMSTPGAPPWASRLRAHMIGQQGNLVDAIEEWEAIRSEAAEQGDEQTVAIAGQHIYDLMVKHFIETIEDAIAAFEQRAGRKPETLAELTRAFPRLRQTVFTDAEGYPLNPNDDRFLYNPLTGEVTDPGAEQARTSR